MGYSVKEKAEYVGTFRWVEIQLMEMLARWVPTTPEMEIKVLFGRHVWDCAQHADALGRRVFELRAPLHFTLPAVLPFATLLREVAELAPTADRLSTFYSVVCPGVADRYRGYMANTDTLMDEPTVRILESALRDFERMLAERDRLTRSAPALAPTIRPHEWRERERSIVDIVAHGESSKLAFGV